MFADELKNIVLVQGDAKHHNSISNINVDGNNAKTTKEYVVK